MDLQAKWPIVVMPPVYEISLGMWQWCKIGEMCDIIPNVAKMAEVEFAPTPEELIGSFCGLAKRNRNEFEAKKLFRYSLDGRGLRAKEVLADGITFPPAYSFRLDVEGPYSRDIFVPAGWTIDVMKAIRFGSVKAAELNGEKLGFGPHNPPVSRLFRLDGKRKRKPSDAYGLKEHLNRSGSGQNLLRTVEAAQPNALMIGDRYATGELVTAEADDSFGGTQVILRGKKVKVAARLPIAILPPGEWSSVKRTEKFSVAERLEVGDVLTTGDVVSALPSIDPETGTVQLFFADDPFQHGIETPLGLPIALASEDEKLVLAPLIDRKKR